MLAQASVFALYIIIIIDLLLLIFDPCSRSLHLKFHLFFF